MAGPGLLTLMPTLQIQQSSMQLKSHIITAFSSRDPVVRADGQGQPVKHIRPSWSWPGIYSQFRLCVFIFPSHCTAGHPWGLYNTNIMKRYFTLVVEQEGGGTCLNVNDNGGN